MSQDHHPEPEPEPEPEPGGASDELLVMHWQAWGRVCVFVGMFRTMPRAPGWVPPARLARLIERSILTGEIQPPLKGPIVRFCERG